MPRAPSPAMELIIKSEPSLRGTIRLKTERARRNAESKFWSMPASQVASSISKPGGQGCRPTLATAPKMGPNSDSIRETAVSMSVADRMSPAMVQSRSAPYWSARRARDSSRASAPRAVMASFAPSARQASTIPSPIPRLAPATKITLSLSCRSMSVPDGSVACGHWTGPRAVTPVLNASPPLVGVKSRHSLRRK